MRQFLQSWRIFISLMPSGHDAASIARVISNAIVLQSTDTGPAELDGFSVVPIFGHLVFLRKVALWCEDRTFSHCPF